VLEPYEPAETAVLAIATETLPLPYVIVVPVPADSTGLVVYHCVAEIASYVAEALLGIVTATFAPLASIAAPVAG
jgi:hypothetical protein